MADATTGHVLDMREARAKRPVASLTKVATAVLILDWCDLKKINLGELVVIPPQAVNPAYANPVGFHPGDRASIRDLLFCALLQSDNIAAEALAQHFGAQLPGDPSATPPQRFVQQMNALAKSLRMDRTLFLNPHGIDAKENPYSTAQDLARLMKHAMSKASFTFFISQKERRISVQRAPVALLPPSAPGAEIAVAPTPGVPASEPGVAPGAAVSQPPSDYLLRNTNEILGQMGVDGGKTGQTAKAGGCLIVTASKAPLTQQAGNDVRVTPRKLIVVVLGSANRFNEALGLVQRGWTQFDQWSAQGRPMDAGKNEL